MESGPLATSDRTSSEVRITMATGGYRALMAGKRGRDPNGCGAEAPWNSESPEAVSESPRPRYSCCWVVQPGGEGGKELPATPGRPKRLGQGRARTHAASFSARFPESGRAPATTRPALPARLRIAMATGGAGPALPTLGARLWRGNRVPPGASPRARVTMATVGWATRAWRRVQGRQLG